MKAAVVLILKSDLDLNTLLPLSRRMLGYSPAKTADGSAVQLPELVHAVACLSAFRDEDAPATVSLAATVLGLISVGFLVAADERDMVNVLDAASGMETVVTNTVERGIQAAIISGTLVQWQRSIKLTCSPQASITSNVRHVYNLMYRQLVKIGFRELFDGVKVSEQSDHTFLLEDRR